MSYVFDALRQAQRRSGNVQWPPWEACAAVTAATEYERVEPTTVHQSGKPEEATSLLLDPRPEDRLVVLTDPQSVGAEKFRLLASRLRQAQKQAGFRRLLITSSAVGEGKSVITANLGFSMAKYAGLRVLLIDSDSRRASLSTIMNCKSAAGLNEWLSERGSIARFARRYADLPLWCMPSGKPSANPHRRFEVDYLSKALASTDEMFDLVIIDSPPVTVLADATIWLGVTDACILVVRRSQTPKRMLERALAGITPSKLLGVVLNEFSDSSHSYYEQYYGTAPER